ncbi:MAG: hypothetical protein HN348_36535, partial [Proteobacteria bacterium]|nr:hypothetical protein [Pseudomonadota bacterium]
PPPQFGGFVRVREAELPDSFQVGVSLGGNYGLHPFELGNPADGYARSAGIVDHLVGVDVGLAIATTNWLSLGVTMPVLQIGANGDAATAIADHLGLGVAGLGYGDAAISVSFQPLRQKEGGAPLSLALTPRVVLPTGDREGLVSSGSVDVGFDLALGSRWKHFRIVGNLGYLIDTGAENLLTVRGDDEIRFALGMAVPLADDQVEIQCEFVGGTAADPQLASKLGFGGPLEATLTPMELSFGASFHPNKGPVMLALGVGPGIGPGFGTPDMRAFTHLTFTGPKAKEEGDLDGDGLVGLDDRCPNDPEDFDEYQDEDGCPDPDNDSDRILDVVDDCPLDPEDI